MARVNIFLSDELLKAVDAEAANSNVGRSSLVQSALALYLAARQRERDEAQIRLEMNDACRGMDALAEKLGAWDPVTVIREFRENRAVVVHEPKARSRTNKRKART